MTIRRRHLSFQISSRRLFRWILRHFQGSRLLSFHLLGDDWLGFLDLRSRCLFHDNGLRLLNLSRGIVLFLGSYRWSTFRFDISNGFSHWLFNLLCLRLGCWWFRYDFRWLFPPLTVVVLFHVRDCSRHSFLCGRCFICAAPEPSAYLHVAQGAQWPHVFCDAILWKPWSIMSSLVSSICYRALLHCNLNHSGNLYS